jgi:hypothetical protein
MQAAVQGADILVIAPTGMGKVSNYSFATLILKHYIRVYVFKYQLLPKRYALTLSYVT